MYILNIIQFIIIQYSSSLTFRYDIKLFLVGIRACTQRFPLYSKKNFMENEKKEQKKKNLLNVRILNWPLPQWSFLEYYKWIIKWMNEYLTYSHVL